MIEKIVIQYLSDRLEVPVCAERPENPEDSYVIVEKTGGGKRNGICTAMIAVQSHAKSMLGAAELNELVKDTMENIITLSDVSKCSLNSDYNFTDTQTKEYRYQAVFDLVHY